MVKCPKCNREDCVIGIPKNYFLEESFVKNIPLKSQVMRFKCLLCGYEFGGDN